MDSLMYDTMCQAVMFALAFSLTIMLVGALVFFIRDKVKEHRKIKARALEDYVQYRIRRYLHKGY